MSQSEEGRGQDHSAPEILSHIQDILKVYMGNLDQHLQQARAELRNQILPGMRPFQVTNIEIAYSGYGDSGAIDGIQFRDASGMRVDRNTIPATLTERLEQCVYAFLPAGFEINDGGQGTVTIDLVAGKITLKHEQNEVVPRDSTCEWEV